MREEAVSLASGDRRLSGLLLTPPGPVTAAVVLAYPLFEERKSAHKVLADAARALGAAGCAVLRFDYRGCGDSEGAFPEFSAPDWMADIRAAAAWLKAKHAGPLGFLGLRLGASLGACAAGGRFDFGILWEPVLQGRVYLEQELRRKLMKEMLTFGRSQASRDALAEALAAGRPIDFDGYAVTPALHRDLGEVDLLTMAASPFPRALLVSIGPSERLAPGLVRVGEAWDAGGGTVTLKAVREQPFWSLVGLAPCPALLAATAAWIREGGAV